MADLKGKVLAGKILVQPQEAEKKTASGIIIPDSAKEKPQIGQVWAVGTGTQCSCDDCDKSGSDGCCGKGAMVVSVGQKVMYKKWGGNEVKVGGEEWMIVEQKDILAIVE
ncbi:MAG TPA: co-chaperone GroES [Prolixibacteraceae bacterium]|nr:co-chaperone GroES [Prolixibacteraceae bacterium]